jgi:hypothetical protein
MQFCSHVAMSFAIIELKGYMFQHFSLCIAVVRHVWLCSSHSNVTVQIDAHDDFRKRSAAGSTDNQWLMPGMDITCRLVSLFDFMPGLALGHIKCSCSIEKGIFLQTRCGMRLGCCPGFFCILELSWRTYSGLALAWEFSVKHCLDRVCHSCKLGIYGNFGLSLVWNNLH